MLALCSRSSASRERRYIPRARVCSSRALHAVFYVQAPSGSDVDVRMCVTGPVSVITAPAARSSGSGIVRCPVMYCPSMDLGDRSIGPAKRCAPLARRSRARAPPVVRRADVPDRVRDEHGIRRYRQPKEDAEQALHVPRVSPIDARDDVSLSTAFDQSLRADALLFATLQGRVARFRARYDPTSTELHPVAASFRCARACASTRRAAAPSAIAEPMTGIFPRPRRCSCPRCSTCSAWAGAWCVTARNSCASCYCAGTADVLLVRFSSSFRRKGRSLEPPAARVQSLSRAAS